MPGIVALGEACRLPILEVAALRDRLERGVLERIPETRMNGAGAERTPNTTNMVFAGVEGEALLIALDLAGYAVSSGSACSSGAVQPSHVLTAMGLPAADAKSSLRFSVGNTNTADQVDGLLDVLEKAVSRLRKLSPSCANLVKIL